MKTTNKNKPKPHPHAELIKAWADGAEIQYFDEYAGAYGEWLDVLNNTPMWDVSIQYRIKPTNVSGNVGSKVGSKDEEIKALKEELETLQIRCDNLHKAKEQLIASHAAIDGVTLTGGEIALIKALRNGNIFKVYEGDSLLVFTDDDDGLQVDGYAIAFASAGRNDEIRACLKKIKAEQEASND